MATKRAAESTLYHVHPQGFWKKFRDAVVVNPEISSGVPIAGVNRYPQPASRPEKYATPATKASDPAQNPYWKRDVRRAYPQLSVVSQKDLSTLLIQHSENPSYVAPPSSQAVAHTLIPFCSAVEGEEKSSVPAAAPEPLDLAAAISAITSASKVYSVSKLPPRLPIPHKRWRPELAPEAPHDPDAYFPMVLYK
ncbi:hypothetical protein PLICRDRAFT_102856 [Plicaturopsis crispa FD-325 SS-3]|nr:hypothetical protein PLICRDRAFT_102856 [Plicaturopsis crispa FD-325 SS-3]